LTDDVALSLASLIILFSFGDRVKTWLTMRGPQTEAKKGFDTGEFPPLIKVS